LKLLVDRTQCLYNRKYTLKDRLPPGEVARRRGAVIAACGSRLPNAFDGLDLTMKYFFDALQMTWGAKLYVPRSDRRHGDPLTPERLRAARDLGCALASP
jgi:hypothetical protein